MHSEVTTEMSGYSLQACPLYANFYGLLRPNAHRQRASELRTKSDLCVKPRVMRGKVFSPGTPPEADTSCPRTRTPWPWPHIRGSTPYI